MIIDRPTAIHKHILNPESEQSTFIGGIWIELACSTNTQTLAQTHTHHTYTNTLQENHQSKKTLHPYRILKQDHHLL